MKIITSMQSLINDLAEDHLEFWKDRYYRKSKKAVAFDLRINHDYSSEIERANKFLGRKMNAKEETAFINAFRKAVVKLLY
jgi:hypothetical protein